MQKRALENDKQLKYVVETKIDGLSVALEYKNGEFCHYSKEDIKNHISNCR